MNNTIVNNSLILRFLKCMYDLILSLYDLLIFNNFHVVIYIYTFNIITSIADLKMLIYQ